MKPFLFLMLAMTPLGASAALPDPIHDCMTNDDTCGTAAADTPIDVDHELVAIAPPALEVQAIPEAMPHSPIDSLHDRQVGDREPDALLLDRMRERVDHPADVRLLGARLHDCGAEHSAIAGFGGARHNPIPRAALTQAKTTTDS